MPPTPPALLPEPMETLIAQELEEWVATFDSGSGGTGVAGGQVGEHEGGNGADRRRVTAEASVGRQYKRRRLNDKPPVALPRTEVGGARSLRLSLLYMYQRK